MKQKNRKLRRLQEQTLSATVSAQSPSVEVNKPVAVNQPELVADDLEHYEPDTVEVKDSIDYDNNVDSNVESKCEEQPTLAELIRFAEARILGVAVESVPFRDPDSHKHVLVSYLGEVKKMTGHIDYVRGAQVVMEDMRRYR